MGKDRKVRKAIETDQKHLPDDKKNDGKEDRKKERKKERKTNRKGRGEVA